PRAKIPANYELTVIAIVGVVLLIGIVKKNAIMMIDFALTAERYEGKSPLEAIHEACLLRFRPIMMTTFAALFGGLPIAIGGGAGSELRRPLGVASSAAPGRPASRSRASRRVRCCRSPATKG